MHGKNGGGIPPVTNRLYMGRMVAMDFLSHCTPPKLEPNYGTSRITLHIYFKIYLPSWVGPTNNLC